MVGNRFNTLSVQALEDAVLAHVSGGSGQGTGGIWPYIGLGPQTATGPDHGSTPDGILSRLQPFEPGPVILPQGGMIG